MLPLPACLYYCTRDTLPRVRNVSTISVIQRKYMCAAAMYCATFEDEVSPCSTQRRHAFSPVLGTVLRALVSFWNIDGLSTAATRCHASRPARERADRARRYDQGNPWRQSITSLLFAFAHAMTNIMELTIVTVHAAHLLLVLIMPSFLCSPQYTPRRSPMGANEAPRGHPGAKQRVLRMLIIFPPLWSRQKRGYLSPSRANEACFTHSTSSHLVLVQNASPRRKSAIYVRNCFSRTLCCKRLCAHCVGVCLQFKSPELRARARTTRRQTEPYAKGS